MVKQKPQPRKPKDEVALDVRTDLVQAEDLLVSRWLEYCSLQGFLLPSHLKEGIGILYSCHIVKPYINVLTSL